MIKRFHEFPQSDLEMTLNDVMVPTSTGDDMLAEFSRSFDSLLFPQHLHVTSAPVIKTNALDFYFGIV